MNTAEALAAILSAAASLLWFTYRLGIAAGEDRAKRKADERTQAESKAKIDVLVQQIEVLVQQIEVLERQLAATRAELAALQPKRKRSLVKREHTLTGN